MKSFSLEPTADTKTLEAYSICFNFRGVKLSRFLRISESFIPRNFGPVCHPSKVKVYTVV